MKLLILLLLILPFFLLTGCQMGYLVKSSYYQLKLLGSGESLERALQDPNLDEKTKKKILLVKEAKTFAIEKMGLSKNRNYERFVQ